MLRRIVIISFLFLSLALVFSSSLEAGSTPRVDVLEVKGAIVPVVADYIERGIRKAEKEGSSALIILLDTPGGLVSATQKIIQTILASQVPVVVYVSPAGAWAGSAGAFITLAGHVAAMAPGTFIGAAHPVALAPGQEGQPQPAQEKIVNALASAIKAIAQERGRNVEVAEDMVRKSVAKTDKEALELNLIDLRASDLSELLLKLETEIKEVRLTGDKRVPLKTQNAVIRYIPMSTIERFFFIISDPNIAYLLLTFSMIAIMAEIYNPGMLIPGVLGGIGLIISLYSLGILGANWAGIMLIALAFALLLAEVLTAGVGFLLAGGITAFIAGSLLLFAGSPVLKIDPWLIAVICSIIAALFIFITRAIVRAQRLKQQTGREGMIGQVAVVKTPLNPKGVVLFQGELWEAIIDEGNAKEGEEVIVERVNGLRLWVKKGGKR